MPAQIIIFLFILIALIGFLCLARGIYETYILKVSHVSFGSNRKSKNPKNKIRVFLFSDIHVSYLNIRASQIAKEITKSGADVVLFAGDMINKGNATETLKLKAFFKTICKAAKEINIPIFAVLGNHDSEQLAKEITDTTGVDNLRFLLNSSVVIKSSDNSIWQITGLEDIRIGNPDYKMAHDSLSCSEVLKPPANNKNNEDNDLPEIILSHNPDSIYTLPFISNPRNENTKNKFFLSGHFHGGQIWMPFGLEYKILRKEKMASEGFRRGSFEYKSLKGYITRGVGCVVVPLRFLSYPEVVVLEL